MHRLEVTAMRSRLNQLLPATFALLAVLLVHVTHALGAHIQGKADGVLSVLHVAAPLHYVLRLQVEGNRAVNLLEESTEKAEVIVLPLDLAGDLVHKF